MKKAPPISPVVLRVEPGGKPKPKLLRCLITTATNNTMDQSELKENTCN